jgi:hypothetical protein
MEHEVAKRFIELLNWVLILGFVLLIPAQGLWIMIVDYWDYRKFTEKIPAYSLGLLMILYVILLFYRAYIYVIWGL